MAVKVPSARRRTRKVQAWSSEEARRFLESARAEGDSLYAAYALVLLGLRKGEVLGLLWDDIDLDAGELRMGRQLQRVRRRLVHRETKTASSDDVVLPLVDLCTAALRHREIQQAVVREAAGVAWQGGKWIFSTKWGTPIEPRNFNRAWDTRCRKAAKTGAGPLTCVGDTGIEPVTSSV